MHASIDEAVNRAARPRGGMWAHHIWACAAMLVTLGLVGATAWAHDLDEHAPYEGTVAPDVELWLAGAGAEPVDHVAFESMVGSPYDSSIVLGAWFRVHVGDPARACPDCPCRHVRVRADAPYNDYTLELVETSDERFCAEGGSAWGLAGPRHSQATVTYEGGTIEAVYAIDPRAYGVHMPSVSTQTPAMLQEDGWTLQPYVGGHDPRVEVDVPSMVTVQISGSRVEPVPTGRFGCAVCECSALAYVVDMHGHGDMWAFEYAADSTSSVAAFESCARMPNYGTSFIMGPVDAGTYRVRMHATASVHVYLKPID